MIALIRTAARLALSDTMQDTLSFLTVLAFVSIVAAYIG